MIVLEKTKKDIIVLVVGKILQVAISLVALKILTEVLTVEEVGNYYLLISLLIFFNFTFLNPLGQYYARKIIDWEKSGNILNATIVLIGIRLISIFVALFFSLGVFRYFEYDGYYSLFEFIVFIFIALFAGTYLVLIGAVNTLGDRVKYMKMLVFSSILGLLISLLMVFLLSKSGMSWLYGVAIAQLICLIPAYRALVKKNIFSLFRIKKIIRIEYIKKVSYFILPVTVTLFLQWGQNVSYRFIVEAKYSIEILAFIAVGLSVSNAIFASVEGVLTQYSIPIYLRKISHATRDVRVKAWNELADYLVPFYMLLMVAVVVLAPYLVKVLVAGKFHEAYVFTMIGASIEFFRVMTGLVYLVSQSEMKTNTTIMPYTMGVLISLSTLYLVNFDSQLWMIAIVLNISYSLVFLLLFLNMRQLLPIKINLHAIGKILILAIPFLGICFLDANYSIGITLIVIAISGLYFVLSLYVFRYIEYRER